MTWVLKQVLVLSLAWWHLPTRLGARGLQVVKKEELQCLESSPHNFWVNQIKNSHNFGLVHIGDSSRMCTSSMTSPTPLFGSSQMTESTPLLQPTRCNLRALSRPPSMPRFGEFGRPPNVNFLLGWLCKIECRRRRDFNVGIGRIVEISPYATKFKGRRTISCTSVDLPNGYGERSFLGVASRRDLWSLGMMNLPLMCGGQISPWQESNIEKRWHP